MKDLNIDSLPFLQSKKLYDDLYGNSEQRYKKSVLINIVLSAALIISIGGLINLGGQVKHIPYLVTTDGKTAVGQGSIEHQEISSQQKGSLGKYFLTQFIKNIREVSVDGEVEEDKIKASYSLARGAALTKAVAYVKKVNPYEIATKNTINITNIHHILKISSSTYKARWTESINDSQTGFEKSKRTMVGEFNINWGAPSNNEKVLKTNPLGFYIVNYSWIEERV